MTSDYAGELRKRVSQCKNMSALARYAGVTRKTLYDFVAGSTPILQNLEAIDRALNEMDASGDNITQTDQTPTHPAVDEIFRLTENEMRLIQTHRSADPYKYIHEAILDLKIANDNLPKSDVSTKKILEVTLKILEEYER